MGNRLISRIIIAKMGSDQKSEERTVLLRRLIFALIIFLSAGLALGSDKTDLGLKTSSPSHEAALLREQDQDVETNRFWLANYSPTDSWLPNKVGISVGVRQSRWNSLELEYLTNGVGTLITMDEHRISVLGRSHIFENSFNLIYGVGYSGLSAGAELSFLGVKVANFSILEIRSLGLQLGIGNRWNLGKNMVLGVDWLSILQPIYTSGSLAGGQLPTIESDPILGSLIRIPRIGVAKVQFGMRF